MPRTAARCSAEFGPQISNEWFSYQSISHDVIWVFPFFFYFLLKVVNLADSHEYPCIAHLLLPPGDPRMTLNLWPGIHPLRAEITDAHYCTKLMQCWGSNSGLWAYQALSNCYGIHSRKSHFAAGGFEMVRWSMWSMCLPLPPSSCTLRTAAALSSCIWQIETLSTLSERIVGSQWNRQTFQVASCLSETWLCRVLYTVFL